MDKRLLSHIKVDPDMLDGRPHIDGTSITVLQILEALAEGLSVNDLLSDYPPLTPIHVQAAFTYAAFLVERVHRPKSAS
jgi:uncharacterized protein (DUF433 family)